MVNSRKTKKIPSQNFRQVLMLGAAFLMLWGVLGNGDFKQQSTPAEAATLKCVFPPHMAKGMSHVWDKARPNLEYDMHQNLKEGVRNPYILYWTQEYLQNFVIMANECDNRHYLEQASKVLNIPFGYQTAIVDIDGTNAVGWACGSTACPAFSPEKPTLETFLYSAQYFYVVSRTLNAISDIPPAERTFYMKSLYKRIPTIAYAYDRWLFGAQNYNAKVINIPNSTRVDDKMMLLAGGITELFEIMLKEPDAFPGPELQQKMKGMLPFIDKFGSLLDTRTRVNATYPHHVLMTFDDIWQSHADSKCASHTLPTEPVLTDCKALPRLTMDIGHMKRLAWVIDTYRHQGFIRSISQARLARIVDGLSNQFAIRVVEGAYYNPTSGAYNPGRGELYRNYFSGTDHPGSRTRDGWYRVKFNEDGSFKSGTAPFKVTGIPFAYFIWGRDDVKVQKAMWAWYDHYGFDLGSNDKDTLYVIMRGMPIFMARP